MVDRPLRRRFSPSYKLRVVEEADRCTEPGEVGQLLRREGLYSSHLTTWRKAAHRDHCLVKKPLQLDTDVWTLITDRPNDHSLILSDPHGLPLRISGTQLQDMQQSGRLTLYPATYRLVMKEGT